MLGIVHRLLILSNYKSYSGNQRDAANRVQHTCPCSEALLIQYCGEGNNASSQGKISLPVMILS